MFSIKCFRFALPAAFAFAAATLSAAPSATAPNSEFSSPLAMPITLRAGTNVTLSLNADFNATDVAVGNALDFMVRNDVTVNGKVLIAAGAPATGIVQKVELKGNSLSMTIAVESVQAVDGQTVNLNSIPHIVKTKVGSASQAHIGTLLSARVRNDIRING